MLLSSLPSRRTLVCPQGVVSVEDIKRCLEQSPSVNDALQALSGSFTVYRFAVHCGLLYISFELAAKMPTFPTLRLPTIIPAPLRRFVAPLNTSPTADTLSIRSSHGSSTSTLPLGHYSTSTTSLGSILYSSVDNLGVALGTPLQYGPPPKTVWYCGNCGDGPHNYTLNPGCIACGHARDGCCTVTTSSR